MTVKGDQEYPDDESRPDRPTRQPDPTQGPTGYPPPWMYSQPPAGWAQQGTPPPYATSAQYPVGQPYAVMPSYPVVHPYSMAPRTTNATAVVAFLLALFWLGGLGSFLGLLLGIAARKECEHRGQKGDGLAIAAMVLGVLGLAIAVFTYAT